MPRTLFEKIWDAHVVRDLGDGWALLHIDRHLLHDLSGPPALAEMARRKLKVRDPELTFAVADHAVSSAPGRTAKTFELGGRLYGALRKLAADQGIRFFDLGQNGQGIVHVMGPELGLVLPGLTLICGDSHTCTNGALGALTLVSEIPKARTRSRPRPCASRNPNCCACVSKACQVRASRRKT
jgi:3-isopropylmalate/(R)-2-methylmalate dehydratase large subunit